MPNNETLIKWKIGSLSSIDNGAVSGTVFPAIDPGSVLFGVDSTNEKGKILLDLPDGTKRIVMSTDAEYADVAGTLNPGASIDGVTFTGSQGIIHYGSCSTPAATAAKTVNCSNFTLTTGSRIIVKYTNTNTASAPTLNVNSTGAKAIYYNGSSITPSALKANDIHEYVYDGTYWNYVGTIALNIAVSVDENAKTLYITSPIVNGDGVNY